MSNDLKPCPFCGSKAVYFDESLVGYHHVECHVCPASVSGETQVHATTAWNTRRVDGFDNWLQSEREKIEQVGKDRFLYESELARTSTLAQCQRQLHKLLGGLGV
jgi:Lar family restriction alleviation protein